MRDGPTEAERRALAGSIGPGDENDLTDEEVFAMWAEATPVEPDPAEQREEATNDA